MTASEKFDFPKTETAMRRLESAIARIEAALGRAPQRDLLLAEELRDSRAEYMDLHDAARTVSTRLDSAIGRLKVVLEA